MSAAILLSAALVCFAFAYRFYGRFLAKTFDLDGNRTTPAHEMRDNIDFIPAKNWWVLFGHHFSSICGAGPIVGPVLACAYWGWGVSIIWIVVGAIWMGAVSDFTSLVMSVRAKGQSIAQISGFEISKRVKIYFSVFLWISLVLVIAVFSIFAAKTLVTEPDAVVPSFGLIPAAFFAGWLMYRTKIPNSIATLIGLGILGVLLWGGTQWHVTLPAMGSLTPENIWILILLVYCFAASVLPVNMLLQPRDYLASFILFGMILIGIAGIFVTQPLMKIPAYTSFLPANQPAAGPLWPMLFVTIACGAISGFHSLVSSGTTCKQISTEGHCQRIGYGGMLLESVVGILVLIAVSAGLGKIQLAALLKEGGPITAFSHGYGAISEVFLGGYGRAFAVLALNAFILTTLDTATRITRYMTSELFGIQNKFLSTMIVVLASGWLALTGQWNLLWPAFGAANQLIAGITLMIASCWLFNRGKGMTMTIIPAILMLLTTIGAFGYQCFNAYFKKTDLGDHSPDWLMVLVTFGLILIAISILAETFTVVLRKKSKDLIKPSV